MSSFNICINCNVEFGYEDMTINSIMRYRNKWLEEGNTITEEGMKNLKISGWIKDD